jgi:hypothetical protein
MSDMSSKQALIPIMTGQYERISAIESEWEIRFKEGDMRPRIDYFHDAVRALTSGEASPYEKNSRLSVEYLAYDLSQLRQVQGNPIGRIHRGNRPIDPGSLTVSGQAAAPSSPDSSTRRELAQLYKDYTVLFAALFAEIADMNFQARAEQVDQAVQDIALVEQILQQLANGQIRNDQAVAMLEQVEQDNLRKRMQQAVAQGTIRRSEQEQISSQLKQFENQLENEKKQADKAHTSYLTGQLAVYEEARDTVKRLAAQGMNLAGKFVEAAMTQAAGKGRGM